LEFTNSLEDLLSLPSFSLKLKKLREHRLKIEIASVRKCFLIFITIIIQSIIIRYTLSIVSISTIINLWVLSPMRFLLILSKLSTVTYYYIWFRLFLFNIRMLIIMVILLLSSWIIILLPKQSTINPHNIFKATGK